MRKRNLKALLILFLAVNFLLHVSLAWNSRDLLQKGYPDFTTFYAAGKMVRNGAGGKLYDPPAQFEVQQQFASEVSTRKGPLPYMHPPFEALLFALLAWLSYPAAYLLWNLLNLLVLLSLPFLLRPHIPWLQKTSPVFVWLASLCFFPVFLAFLQGQDVVLLLLVFSLVFVALKNHHDLAAGVWLGLGLFRFHMVLPMLFIFLWKRRGKTVLGFALSACALALISVAVVGWHGALAYPGQIWHKAGLMEQQGMIAPADAPNLRGLVDLLLANLGQRWRHLIEAAASVAVLLFAAVHWKSSSAREFDLGFSLCVLAAVLSSYYAFGHDLSLLLLPAALVINYILDGSVPSNWREAGLLVPLAILFCAPLQMFLGMRHDLYSLMAVVLLVWGWSIARGLSRQSRTT